MRKGTVQGCLIPPQAPQCLHDRPPHVLPARIVQSTLDYASTCYVHCLSAKLRDKLESTSNRCLRRVFGHDLYTSIDFILTKYNRYTFSRRVNLKLFVFVFRCLFRCTSPLLSTIPSDSLFTVHGRPGQYSGGRGHRT